MLLRLAAIGVAAASLSLSVVSAVPASAAADQLPECSGVSANQPRGSSLLTVPSSDPLEQIGVRDAQHWLRARGIEPGAGTTVAVVDSGVGAGVPRAPGSAAGTPAYFHGSAVAGIIAGPLGIAPAARILDLRVYTAEDSPGGPQVSAAGVRSAFDQLVAHPEWRVSIVNASLEIGDDPGVAADIAKLRKRGVIVVASTGNRTQQASGVPSTYIGGEDFARHYFPAGYDGVLGVSAVAPPGGDTAGAVLANSATDLSAPTAGLRTLSVLGSPCLLGDVATSWATAEVSGVLALLRSAYPDAHPAELVARVESTASGRTDVRTDFAGAGTVQAYEALTRPLTLSPSGRQSTDAVAAPDDRASVPPSEPDVLAGTRHLSVWWGLLGGGALLLALVLRPVLSRRSRPASRPRG
ncbi:S8 family serine peptidase [Nocardioides sp. BP30]|uniref:S8 family serine peptidase n=1 Tax=Nocardioides sp. BP30 TaxID=3036374 RepID=UPI002469A961|nr:S8 family serine peptidase [Nocardioides sp. BP30]WGL52756.1 S8 family serine peptidase [Nocardioides sp. BP30]